MTCKDAVQGRGIKVQLSARMVEPYSRRQRVSAERPISTHTSFTYTVSNVEEKFSSFKEQKVVIEKTDSYHPDAGWSGIRYYHTIY